MSWTDWIVKFEDKEQVCIDWNIFFEYSQKYGEILPSPHSCNIYELKMKKPFGEVYIHGGPSVGVSAISIDKPTENEHIRPFIFDFLNSFGMILCDQNFSGGVSSKDVSKHIPERTLLEGVKIVNSANELYT